MATVSSCRSDFKYEFEFHSSDLHSLQCLSNVQPLREYFIGEIYAYREHINYTNPLAAGGEVAIAYGTLIEKMWDGKWRYISPQQIKVPVHICTVLQITENKFDITCLKTSRELSLTIHTTQLSPS
jgi:hypothetical protein